jgi:hypothetical protein
MQLGNIALFDFNSRIDEAIVMQFGRVLLPTVFFFFA